MAKHIDRREFIQHSAFSAAGAAAIAAGTLVPTKARGDTSSILNYNENMEYRRLGSTDLMISAVCMGGHFGEIPDEADVEKNRHDVVSRCIDRGINYLDACWGEEVMVYTKALRGRRDKMYLALSHGDKEVRRENYRTSKKLLASLDELLLASKQEYTDLWRITCHEQGGKHSFNTSFELVDALEKAKKQGKARFIGLSTHDYRFIKLMVEHFPQLDVVLFPYTSMSKRVRVFNTEKDSIFDVLKAHDVGAFGIKPFGGRSLFKGTSLPDSPTANEDNRMARLTLRRILQNPNIIPIPGLSSIEQADNVARAVVERRELDAKETADLDTAEKDMMAGLPKRYEWLRNWEYV
jgi:aryl-alcohol dehydrogenase-like predicted oxidoreductase